MMTPLSTSFVALVACTALVSAQQQVLGLHDSNSAGLFTPIESLSALSANTFTTLAHPSFPKHSVRVKKSTEFCDPTVNSYTGYIDVEARHIFFYFFESRRDPDKDDVIFWTNGGPGGSSVMGLFLELGPCRIVDEHGPKYYSESWNNYANIFFVDQPVGVGYSYAEYGETVSTTEEAAVDMAAFVAIFFAHFTTFAGRPFHMAGESYGGRYVPLFASAVWDQNAKLEAMGMVSVNLSSIILVNGYTDFYTHYEAKFQFPCTTTQNPPFLPVAQCMRMKQVLPRCLKMLKDSCVDMFDEIACFAAGEFCDAELQPVWASGVNVYDVTKRCPPEKAEIPCLPILNHARDYLRLNTTRAALGADAAVPANASIANPDVGQAFATRLDFFHPSQHHVAALLERGVRAMIFVGTNDWICNYLGNAQWTSELEWSGHHEFNKQEMRVWEVDGARAGEVRAAQGLTFATVEGAGHLAPYNKPKETLEILNKWLRKEPLNGSTSSSN